MVSNNKKRLFKDRYRSSRDLLYLYFSTSKERIAYYTDGSNAVKPHAELSFPIVGDIMCIADFPGFYHRNANWKIDEIFDADICVMCLVRHMFISTCHHIDAYYSSWKWAVTFPSNYLKAIQTVMKMTETKTLAYEICAQFFRLI